MPRWEYMVLDVSIAGFWLGPDLDDEALTAKLNELGAAGWDVVSVAPIGIRQGFTKNLVIVLKRPRDEPLSSTG